MIIQNNSRRTVLLLLLVLLAVTYWLYQLGFSAGFQFDDANSIGGVTGVHDVNSALAYLFGGKSGPLGRPLSLVTFLLQKDSWPRDPAAFYLVNTLIHLFNGVLVYWLSYRLTHFFPEKPRHPTWFALAVTALWLTLPLHVSASLMAVQRMTTLSSMFILLGLIGYVSGRGMLEKSPTKSYWLMSVSVGLGTMLAMLCKESGVLLPGYVLVLEYTLIHAAGTPVGPKFKYWASAFLGIPALFLAAYFAYKWQEWMGGYALRSFSMSERLLTETRILWEYFGQIYLPARGGTGPYHDDYPISRGLFEPGVTAIAMLAWVSAIFAAWWIRKRSPLILFAVLWFLAGHLIESSFIPLELYFEHRNYIASVGPLLAGCVLVWHVPVKVLRLALAGLMVMVLLRMFVLGETTHLWGQNLLSAKVWSEEHPQSARAAQFLTMANFYAGDQDAARKATLDGHARIKNDIALALQSVYLSCQADTELVFLARVKGIEPVLSVGIIGSSTSGLLNKMLEAQQKGGCKNLSLDQLRVFTDHLLLNPHLQGSPAFRASLHVFKYRLYALEGKPNYSIRELLTAFSIQPDMPIAVAVARVSMSAGRYDFALEFLDRAMSFAPRNPVIRFRWKREFDDLKASIAQEKAAKFSGKLGL